MFLRKRGRRVLILQSFRDGQGRMCQRRCGHFADAAGLERQLEQVSQNCPELTVDRAKLREQAQPLLEGTEFESQRRAQRLRKAIRSLLRLLADEDDPDVVNDIAADIDMLRTRLDSDGPGQSGHSQEVVEQLRSQLPPRRRRFDPGEVKAQPYLRAVEQLSEALERQDRLAEAVEVMEERVRACPTPQARLAYGALLQKVGRGLEATEQYARVPNWEADRHYNSAAASWQAGCHNEALSHIFRGLQRNPWVVEALKCLEKGGPAYQGGEYWERFGDLWPPPARKFLLAIRAQLLVGRRLQAERERGVRARNLVPEAKCRARLLEAARTRLSGS